MKDIRNQRNIYIPVLKGDKVVNNYSVFYSEEEARTRANLISQDVKIDGEYPDVEIHRYVLHSKGLKDGKKIEKEIKELCKDLNK